MSEVPQPNWQERNPTAKLIVDKKLENYPDSVKESVYKELDDFDKSENGPFMGVQHGPLTEEQDMQMPEPTPTPMPEYYSDEQ